MKADFPATSGSIQLRPLAMDHPCCTRSHVSLCSAQNYFEQKTQSNLPVFPAYAWWPRPPVSSHCLLWPGAPGGSEWEAGPFEIQGLRKDVLKARWPFYNSRNA